jgi:hypothetical protein
MYLVRLTIAVQDVHVHRDVLEHGVSTWVIGKTEKLILQTTQVENKANRRGGGGLEKESGDWILRA